MKFFFINGLAHLEPTWKPGSSPSCSQVGKPSWAPPGHVGWEQFINRSRKCEKISDLFRDNANYTIYISLDNNQLSFI